MMYDGMVSDEPCETPWQMWTAQQWQAWEDEHGTSWPLQPDWTTPPAETLIEWAERKRRWHAEDVPGHLEEIAPELLGLLDDPPAALTPEHAAQLEALTEIPARLWMRLEALYRADVARAAKVAAMREALGPAASPGEMLKQWADKHDPERSQLNERFPAEEDRVRAILTSRHRLTPDDVLALAEVTGIACAIWADQERAYWEWVRETQEMQEMDEQ